MPKNYVVGAVVATAVLALGALDLTYRGSLRGIMVGLAVVPAFGLLFPNVGSARWRLLPGVLALAAALLVSLGEWRSRPFVVLFTLFDIIALTCVVRHLGVAQRTQGAKGTAEGQVPRRGPSAEHGAWRVNDLQGEFRRLAPSADGLMDDHFHDVRVSPFGTRLLVADLVCAPPVAKAAASDLLYRWRLLAAEEVSLTQLARRLDTALGKYSESYAQAMLINISSDGREVSLVCCGHQPPYLLFEGSATPVSILAPVPALGRIAATGAERPIYLTQLTLAVGKRLLVLSDSLVNGHDVRGKAFPMADEALALDGSEAGVLLDRLAEELRTHMGATARGEVMLIESKDIRCADAACGGVSNGNTAA